MKKIILILVSIIWWIHPVQAQDDQPEAKIKVYARYKYGKGMQLIFLPDKKKIIANAMKNGFVIERANANSNHFVEIARQKAYTNEQWEKMIEQEKNEDTKNVLLAGYTFFKALYMPSEKVLDKDVAAVKNALRDEDRKLFMMLMTTTREPRLMQALGIYYTDTGVEVNKTYKYRVKLAVPDDVYRVKSIDFTALASENLPDYRHLFYVKQDDKQLHFVWKQIEGLQGFDIERAENGSNRFVKINSAPIFVLSANAEYTYTYEDKNLVNYQKYTYRFYARNYFGERLKLFEMTTYPVDRTPPPSPAIQKPEHISPNEVLITWEMKNPPADLKGFVVARSRQNRGKFDIVHKHLLPPSQRKYIDKSFKKDGENYYIVQAIDTANNISSSAPFMVVLTDSIPPAKPVIESAVIDSLGHITLKIKPNREKDLMGYRLYKANSPKHEFSAIREHFLDSLTDTKQNLHIFKDTTTLNTLTPKIYYRVKALDFHYNQSDFSDIYVVKRPDTIHPLAPIFNDVKVFSDRVELRFNTSESEDVIKNYLYRKKNIDGKWKLLAEINNGETLYIDKDVEQETKYYYSMRAVDDAGLFSNYAVAVYAIPYDTKIRPKIKDLKIKKSKDEIKLTWKYPEYKKKVFFVIYKNDAHGNLVQYKRTEKTKFIESGLTKGSYSFAVCAFTSDGGQSPLSETKTIKIEE